AGAVGEALGSGSGDGADVVGGVDLADHVAVGDVDVAGRVDGDAARGGEGRDAVAAPLPVLGSVGAGAGQHFGDAARVHAEDLMVGRRRGVQGAGRVQRQRRGLTELDGALHGAGVAVRGDQAHAVVAGVGDVDVALRIHRQGFRTIELGTALAAAIAVDITQNAVA